jgi:hypothetical protein
MIATPVTGVEMVDAELKRHAPFDSLEDAESLAAKLVAVWRLMQPGSAGSMMQLRRRRRE